MKPHRACYFVLFHKKRSGRQVLPTYESFQNKLYLQKYGLYSQQIKRFLYYFPKAQILILASEELFAQPKQVVKQVLRFVGVDTEFEARNFTPWNVATNKVAVDPEIRQYLNDYFLPHNQELYQLIGRDLSWE